MDPSIVNMQKMVDKLNRRIRAQEQAKSRLQQQPQTQKKKQKKAKLNIHQKKMENVRG